MSLQKILASRGWGSPKLSLLLLPVIVSISKLSGLLREALLTQFFGLGHALDSFILFTTLPTYAFSYLGGPFGLAFYPSLSSHVTPAALARKLLPWLLAVSGLAAVLMYGAAIVAEPRLTADGKIEHYGFVLVLYAAAVPLAALIGLLFCVLNGGKRHVAAMLLSVSQPWCFVAGLLLCLLVWDLPSFTQISLIYFSSYLGVFLLGYGLRSRAETAEAGRWTDAAQQSLRKFRSLLGFSSLDTAGAFANQMLTLFFAGLTGPGGIAAYGLVSRIMQAMLALTVSPMLPVLQNRYRTISPVERRKLFSRTFIRAMAALCILILAMILFRAEIVRLFFQRGAFGPEDSARVTGLIAPYCVYLFFIAANQLCVAAAFVSGGGKSYTVVMMCNYVTGNLLKIPMLHYYGLEGVIWAAAMSEGAAAIVNGRLRMRRGAESDEGAVG